MLRFVLLMAVALYMVAAEPGWGGYGHGHAPIHNEERVWAHNAKRQLWVNSIADHHVGSGTGTADKDGVPGTKYGTRGHGGHGHGGHGHGGHGYGGHGHGGHGYGGHGYGGGGGGGRSGGHGNGGYGGYGHGGYGYY